MRCWTECYCGNSQPLQWRHNERDSVSNHQPHDCFLNHLFRRRSKKTLKLRVTGLCVGNSPGTGEFPAQLASNAENVSIWWRHHGSVWWQQVSSSALMTAYTMVGMSLRMCMANRVVLMNKMALSAAVRYYTSLFIIPYCYDGHESTGFDQYIQKYTVG